MTTRTGGVGPLQATTRPSSRASGQRQIIASLASARTFVGRKTDGDIWGQRKLVDLADGLAFGVNHLDVLEHDKFDLAFGRLAAGEIATDVRTGVVVDADAMAEHIVQL